MRRTLFVWNASLVWEFFLMSGDCRVPDCHGLLQSLVSELSLTTTDSSANPLNQCQLVASSFDLHPKL